MSIEIVVAHSDTPGAEYIGRGSPLGNPFVLGKHGDRDEVVDKYEAWLHEIVWGTSPLSKRVRLELNRLYEKATLEGRLVLGCPGRCAPRRCHGDVIKRHIERVIEQAS